MSSLAPQMALPDHGLWTMPHEQQDGLEREIAQYLAGHRLMQESAHTAIPSIPAVARDATLSPSLGCETYSPASTSSRLSASWSDQSSVRQLASPKSTSRRSLSATSTTPTSPSTSRKPSTAESINSASSSTSVTKVASNTDGLPRCYAHNCHGRVFSCLANYKRHVRERERRIRVSCEYCMKSFSRRSNRDTHVQGGRCKILRSLESNNTHIAHLPEHIVADPDIQLELPASLSPDAYPYTHENGTRDQQYRPRQQDDFQSRSQTYTDMQMAARYPQNIQHSMFTYTYDMGPVMMDEFGPDRRMSFE